ncbi:MAG: 2-phospho-L-lactate transferase [bacterium]
MRVTVLAGGIGGARFLRGVRRAVAASSGSEPAAEITAVVNTGDDVTLHGLRICPDLDSVMYTLGDGIDTERGWGRSGETWRIRDELAAYGAEPTWFGLGDLDTATHLVRTRMLDAGFSLSDVTTALCQRWQPGVRLLPMTDQRCETHVVVEFDGARRAIHFQSWWIEHHAALRALDFVAVGLDEAKPAPGVIEAITETDLLLIAPSNPVVSIGTIVAISGVGDAIRSTPAPVVGVSPIIGGRPVRGMADACLAAIGVEVSAQGVAEHYGARLAGGLLDGWLIAAGDDAAVAGVDVRRAPLHMSDDEATAQMVRAAAAIAGIELPGPSGG